MDLDGTVLAAGEATPWFAVRLAAVSGNRTAGTNALRRVAEAAGAAMEARGIDRPHPGGWCSWYFYFTKVTEADVLDNLDVLAGDGRDGPDFGCEYVMVDDGHQAAIGDWLTTNEKFPSGMGEVARRITAEGFDAGIWWAPFLASARSQVTTEHPEWLVRDERGRPILGLLNPGWGLTTPMRVLDTTHPAVVDHLTHVAAAIGHEWGYAIQKLDFLYAAALPGVRHDAGATRAQALRRGLEAVRAGAGEDAFLLGCGCPLGPAVGVADAMRIGADVTPSWTSLLGRTVGRNRHGLATSHALLNTLTRSVLDGAWFLNDPDCLMVRDTDTKLTEDEVRLLATVFGMTDGMLVLSDRLDRLSPARRAMVAQTRASPAVAPRWSTSSSGSPGGAGEPPPPRPGGRRPAQPRRSAPGRRGGPGPAGRSATGSAATPTAESDVGLACSTSGDPGDSRAGIGELARIGLGARRLGSANAHGDTVDGPGRPPGGASRRTGLLGRSEVQGDHDDGGTVGGRARRPRHLRGPWGEADQEYYAPRRTPAAVLRPRRPLVVPSAVTASSTPVSADGRRALVTRRCPSPKPTEPRRDPGRHLLPGRR